MARPLPKDFPEPDDLALPFPARAGDPTDDERKSFTAARMRLQADIMRDWAKPMTPTVKLIACFLLESVNSETHLCFPSYRTIAETLGIGKEKTVQRGIQALVDRKWLYSWRPDRTRSNYYVFLKNDGVVQQILDYQMSLRDAREADRIERERTQMSTRNMVNGPQMSVRERAQMSGKSFNVIHETILGIEREISLESNPYESGSGDNPEMPFAIPVDQNEADAVMAAIMADVTLKYAPKKNREKLIRAALMHGTLTPGWLGRMFEPDREAEETSGHVQPYMADIPSRDFGIMGGATS